MENLVFERDYSKEYNQASDSDAIAILEQAISGGFLKSYSEAMYAIPKVVVPEYKANYEYVLQLCDDLAKRHGGSIRGIVSYEQWEAHINLVVPFVEFTSPEDLQILRDIAEKSHGVTIQPVDDGIRIHIYNLYFEELISDDGRSYIQYEHILQDEKLAGMLGVPTELPPEMQATADYLNALLDTLEKATGKDRTNVFKEFLFRISGVMHEVNDIYDAMDQIVQDMIDESNS